MTSPAGAVDAQPAGPQELTRELLRLHARIVLRMPWFQLLLIGGFAWVLLEHVDRFDFAVWACLALCVELVRSGAAGLALSRLPRQSAATLRGMHAAFVVLDACAGLSIGLVAVWFLRHAPLLEQMLLETVLFAVAAAGACVALSSRYIVAAYSSAVLLCAGWSWDRLHPSQAAVVTALTFVYWLFLVGVARDAEQLLVRSIAIRRERDAAYADLQAKNDELERLNGQLRWLMAERSRMLAATSHDLRQPLQALSLYSAVLAARPGPQALDEVGRNIEYIVQSVGDLLDNLVDLARLSTGSYPLRPQAFRLDGLVQRSCEAFAQSAATKGLRLHCRIDAPVLLHGDPAAVSRVLRNLLDNALKYTREGSVTVTLERQGEHAVMSVEDTGAGIDARQQARIFEEFYRVDSGDGAQTAGAGLGLAIVKRLCDALQAEIQVGSTPGRGTCFCVRWPNARAADDADVARGVDAAQPSSRRNARIYAVDDDPAVTSSLAQLLQLWGYEVSCASDAEGIEALFVRSGLPQLLISDLRLAAGVDGLALALRLRASHGEFPVLLLCGDLPDLAQERARAQGVPLLRKPVSTFRLRRQIEGLLGPPPR